VLLLAIPRPISWKALRRARLPIIVQTGSKRNRRSCEPVGQQAIGTGAVQIRAMGSRTVFVRASTGTGGQIIGKPELALFTPTHIIARFIPDAATASGRARGLARRQFAAYRRRQLRRSGRMNMTKP